MEMAAKSGALLFLQAQHQFAMSTLIKLLPNQTVAAVLKEVVLRKQGFAVALAANRQIMQVTATPNGFALSGKLLWVTGYHFFQRLLISFDHEGKIYFAWISFFALSAHGGSLQISDRIDTAVFTATHTVSVTFDHWHIPHQEILAIHPTMAKVPYEHPAIYNFAGAAIALLDIAMAGKFKEATKVQQTHAMLLQEWQNYYDKIIQGDTCPLTLRAEGLTLAERCGNFARIVCGSAGLLNDNALTRINREIWQYTIAGFGKEQLEAYLNNA